MAKYHWLIKITLETRIMETPILYSHNSTIYRCRTKQIENIGGTATPDKILDCFHQITTLDNIKVIIINIFGGIVRCDEVARAIIDAQRQIPDLPKLAIRLSGNRESEARQLLAQYNLPLFDSLETILEDIS